MDGRRVRTWTYSASDVEAAIRVGYAKMDGKHVSTRLVEKCFRILTLKGFPCRKMRKALGCRRKQQRIAASTRKHEKTLLEPSVPKVRAKPKWVFVNGIKCIPKSYLTQL